MCEHLKVTVHSRLVAMQTYYEPAEYEQLAQCDECGEWFDLSDVPDSDITDTVTRQRGMPHEYYD